MQSAILMVKCLSAVDKIAILFKIDRIKTAYKAPRLWSVRYIHFGIVNNRKQGCLGLSSPAILCKSVIVSTLYTMSFINTNI